MKLKLQDLKESLSELRKSLWTATKESGTNLGVSFIFILLEVQVVSMFVAI